MTLQGRNSRNSDAVVAADLGRGSLTRIQLQRSLLRAELGGSVKHDRPWEQLRSFLLYPARVLVSPVRRSLKFLTFMHFRAVPHVETKRPVRHETSWSISKEQ